MENQEMEKKNQSALATSQDRRGHEEGSEQEDFIIPFAKLLQPTSPEVSELPDLRAGDLINSLTKEKLPKEFIPICKHTYWIRFNPRSTNEPGYDPNFGPGDMLWKSDSPDDPRVKAESKFGPNGEKPLATKFISFLACFPGVPMPVVIAFAKTSINAGRALNTLTSATPGAMFSSKFSLGVKKVQNDKGTFFVFTVVPAGKPSEEEYQIAERFYNQFASKKDLKVHEEEPEETGGEAGQQTDTDPNKPLNW